VPFVGTWLGWQGIFDEIIFGLCDLGFVNILGRLRDFRFRPTIFLLEGFVELR